MADPCLEIPCRRSATATLTARVLILAAAVSALPGCVPDAPVRGLEDAAALVRPDAPRVDTRNVLRADDDAQPPADDAASGADSEDTAAPPDRTAGVDALAIDAAPDASRAGDVYTPPDALALTNCGSEGPSTGPRCVHDTDCAPRTELCLPTGCGETRRCQPAGRSCASDDDCLAGAQSCAAGRCVPAGTDCGDTRGCPLGFVCEGASGAQRCVDRRRACETDRDCPYNALCYSVRGLSPFCVVVPTRCRSSAACVMGATCRDTDGDGLRECMPPGACDAARCADPARPSCEIAREDYDTACGARGVCSDAVGCAAGYACVDAWNTGVSTCAAATAPCQRQSDCAAPGTVCMDHALDGAPGPGCR